MMHTYILTFLYEFILCINLDIQPSAKVGKTIKYYVPEAGVGDPYNICKGNVTIHLFVDGLAPITYERPDLKKGNGLTQITIIVLLVMMQVQLWVMCTELFPKGLGNNSMCLISLKQW